MFNNYSNELSLDNLISILNKLHQKTNTLYRSAVEVVDDYLEFKVKELIKYIYELRFESKLIDNENSIALFDFKQELLRVDKEITYLVKLV